MTTETVSSVKAKQPEWEEEPFAGHAGPVSGVAVTPDGSQIITGGQDGMIRIWDITTGRQVAVLTGHAGPVSGVAVTPDGVEIVTVGADRSLRAWNRRTTVQVRGTSFGRLVTQAPLAGLRSDAPTEENLLGREWGNVDQLAALAAALSTAPPLSIALLGDWGSGKSSFMLQMQQRIQQLADLSRKNLGRSAFAGSVRQVRFNAWHYSDDQVWTGLVDELFRELARPDQSNQPDATTIADRRAHKDEVRRQLQARQADRVRLDDQLTKTAKTPGAAWLAVLGWPVRLVRTTGMAAGQLLGRDIRASLPLVGLWLLLAAVAAVVWWRWAPQLRSIGIALSGIAGVAASLWTVLQRVRDRGVSWTNRQEQALQARRDEAQREVVRLRAELAQLDAATQLEDTLQQMGAADHYQRFRGLVGQVHDDLRRLENELADVRREWDVSQASVPPPLERIVLYIDDLDRCRPRQVVEVLAAVNLLLALPLFVVVVAVDARWLRRCLAHHQADLFDTDHTGSAVPTETAAGPIDYLDKIFQVPYALRPLGASTPGYLGELLSPVANAAPAVPVTPSSPPPPAPSAVSTGRQPPDATQLPDRPTLPVNPPGGMEASAGARQDQNRAAVAQPIPDLQPASLQLAERERDFLLRLAPLVSTPRIGKKLINLYRLVRIGIPDNQLASFVGGQDGGAHQPVLILLAVLVGRPTLAGPLLAALPAGAPTDDIVSFLQAKAHDVATQQQNDPDTAAHRRQYRELADLITDIRKNIPVRGELADYQRWFPDITRYSFYTIPT